MSAAWIPGDDEVDAIARSVPAPAPTASQAEQMRTRLLAAQPQITQEPRRRSWPLVASISAAVAVAAAVVLWLVVRPGPEAVPPKQVVAAVGTAAFERSSDWPDYVVRLDDGTLDIGVAPLAPGERFRVRSGEEEVEVRGTQFVVQASHAHLTSVVVERGVVELRRPGEPAITLTAGQRWDRAQTASVPRPATPSASVAIATAPPVAPPGASPAPVRDTKPGRTRDVTPARPARIVASAEVPSPPREPAPAVPPASPPPASAKPGEADFRAGWAALRAGNAADATSSFAASCNAAQSEAFGEDACFWTGVAAKRAGQVKLAREALTRFLARFPSSGRAAEASALLGWELYDAGDLDGAEKLFRRAANDRVPKVRESAERGLTAVGRRRASP